MRKPKRDGRVIGAPMATRLRAEGFVPLPRLWVKEEDLPAIHEITEPYRDYVNEVRAQVKAEADAAHNNTNAAPSDRKMTNSSAYDEAERQRAQQIEDAWDKYFQ